MISTLAVAPMMDWTNRHFRYLLRLLSKQTLLYTEMITTGALIHGDTDRFLRYHQSEHPIALQLGGCDPHELALCAKMAEDYGYDEVNINVGCPSDRVQRGKIGACLMAEPELIAECVSQMQAKVAIPVSIKTRIGIDDMDSYEHLHRFIDLTQAAGCKYFSIHARKAWLSGLSPKQNRDIPPLNYDVVYQLKNDFPDLCFAINGGIKTLIDASTHLQQGLDGVMIGRAAVQNPYLFAFADRDIYGDVTSPILSRQQIVESYIPYIEQQMADGMRLTSLTRYIINLYLGVPGAKSWRAFLSQHAHLPGAGIAVIEQALDLVNESTVVNCHSEEDEIVVT